MAASFIVNGRYLTQSITGVQRYARNIVDAIDQLDGVEGATVLTPKSVDDPGYARLATVATGALRGHGWEQVDLPRATRGQKLLNLCNTAPVAKREQIVCIHDANVFASPDSYSHAFRILYRNLQPILVRRSAGIATVSHAAARQLARYLPVSLPRIAVLPNGHEHALRWDADRADLPPELPVREGCRPYVLAIGSKARHKNMALLLDIAPRLDEMGINVVVAGGGGGIYRTELLVERPNVHFCGRVSDDDLAYLLDHALCLAFPSLTEGFGLPIVEAMARGCPVVSSDRSSLPEVCGDAALLASPSDPRQWIDHIRALTQSPVLRGDMAGCGREQCRRFSWKKSAEGYLDMLTGSVTAPVKIAVPPPAPQPRIAAVFATRGRPDIVAATVRHFVTTQTLKPQSVIISCTTLEDAGDLASLEDVRIVLGPVGSSAQRNTALDSLEDGTEIVAFFDDDFVANAEWLARAAQVFRDESGVAGLTGRVIVDGILGPGISFRDALRHLETAGEQDAEWIEPYSPYGCNMAFRADAVGDIRFDERLVLYGWLEDRDFGAQLRSRGHRLVKFSGTYGVHMGVKSGRVKGERLGYSQIANPLYLMRKGTMTFNQVVGQIFRNTSINFVRALSPEPYIDRKGRVKGNLRALIDVLRGDLAPEKAATLGAKEIIATVGRRGPDA